MKLTQLPNPEDIFALIRRYDRTALIYRTKFEAQCELADAYGKRGDLPRADDCVILAAGFGLKSEDFEEVARDLAGLLGITRPVREAP